MAPWFPIRPRVRPDAPHLARIATGQRREARTILRHTRPSDLSPAAAFARRQARELLDQADEIELTGGVQ
jgi:hypothetical protein